MKYPTILSVVDEERVSPEVIPLLHSAYRAIQEPSPDVVALHEALAELLRFLSSKTGRTNANCAAANSFFLDIDDKWSNRQRQLPEHYQDLLGDLAGALNAALFPPEIAEHYHSTPEKLLARLERLDPDAQPGYRVSDMDTADLWTAAITRQGRTAIIHYAEGPGHAIDFDAELGGNETLLIIFAPPPERWDEQVPWAAGRRRVVLERVGEEIARSEGRDLRFVVHRGGVDILTRRK